MEASHLFVWEMPERNGKYCDLDISCHTLLGTKTLNRQNFEKWSLNASRGALKYTVCPIHSIF